MEAVQRSELGEQGEEAQGLVIYNVRLPDRDPERAKKLWTVNCADGKVVQVSESKAALKDPESPTIHLNANGSLMIPSLCHSHIHLDKCFILEKCGELKTGDFQEAMKVTAAAKAEFRFDKDDLYRRGKRLVRESVECGVTSMRAHVEVDSLVKFSCLDVAGEIKEAFKGICDIQIAVFVQERLFQLGTDEHPGQNYHLLTQALERKDIDIEVVGSAPYVEETAGQQRQNVSLILELAVEHGIHADFHLDYNLDPKAKPLIYHVLSEASRLGWRSEKLGSPLRRITIGHATRLQLLTHDEWKSLVKSIGDLPVSFVSLPTSDMYMQGREDFQRRLGAPRGTLRLPLLARKYGLQVAMSVNNVDNAFTPQGSLDPLSLATLGVTLFQSATTEDLRTLMRSVSLTSKRVIGIEGVEKQNLFPSKGDPADFVLLHGTCSLQQAVLNPAYDRTTIRKAVIVARRRTQKWFSDGRPPRIVATVAWYRRVRWWLLFCPPLFFYKLVRGTLVTPPVANAERTEWSEEPDDVHLAGKYLNTV